MSELKNIRARTDVNVPGSAILYFVPSHLVSSVPKPDEPGKINESIVLSGSQKWFFWYCSQKTLGSSIKRNRSRAGSTYIHEASGFVPGDHEEFIAMMEEMSEMRFLAIRKDVNGYFKLLGTLDSPLEFDYQFVANAGSRKGFSFSFGRECRNPEYFYEGLLETEDGYVDTQTASEVIDFTEVKVIYGSNTIVTS